MQQLKKDLKDIARDLNKLTQKTGKIKRQLEKLEKTQAIKKSKGKAKAAKSKATRKKVPQKLQRLPAGEIVLRIIIKSKKGIDTAALREKTGFNDNKMRDIVYRLKKQGKIKSLGRGVYQKA